MGPLLTSLVVGLCLWPQSVHSTPWICVDEDLNWDCIREFREKDMDHGDGDNDANDYCIHVGHLWHTPHAWDWLDAENQFYAGIGCNYYAITMEPIWADCDERYPTEWASCVAYFDDYLVEDILTPTSIPWWNDDMEAWGLYCADDRAWRNANPICWEMD